MMTSFAKLWSNVNPGFTANVVIPIGQDIVLDGVNVLFTVKRMYKFAVTYEIVTPESAENGEFEDVGFVDRSCSLREALKHCESHDGEVEADEFPVKKPRWITFYNCNNDPTKEQSEARSIHFPEELTTATRMRIARLVKCYGVR